MNAQDIVQELFLEKIVMVGAGLVGVVILLVIVLIVLRKTGNRRR